MIVILYTLLLLASCGYQYKNYTEYLKEWDHLVATTTLLKEVEVNKDGYELPKTDCLGECKYPLFEFHQPPLDEWKPTILIVSGFHGDQPLSPHIALEFARKLHHGHIIFFPLANPSGYAHKTREQQPSGRDPNRDFPYSNDDCMHTATSRLLDKVYRRWKIDLTVTIHQGGDELAWSWGTRVHLREKSADESIYREIAEGVNRQLKTGWLGMSSLQLGQMNEVIYPAEGSFEDWAYAASWDTLNPTSQCPSFKFPPYELNTHQGLVYIFESGGHNVPEDRLESYEEIKMKKENDTLGFYDYISRGIKILSGFVDAANPRLEVTATPSDTKIFLKGCSTAKLFITAGDRVFKADVKGSLNEGYQCYQLNTSEMVDAERNKTFVMGYQMSCDIHWRSVGRTSFSRGRDYRGSQEITIAEDQKEQSSRYVINVFGVEIDVVRWAVIGAVIMCLVLMCLGLRFARHRSTIKLQQHQQLKEESTLNGSCEFEQTLQTL